MDIKQFPIQSLLRAVLVAGYVTLVAFVMFYGEQIAGRFGGVIGIIGFLMLFVLSAAVVGLLIFAKPVMLYIDGKKKEAVTLLGYTVAWLFVLTALIFVVLILV